MPTLVNNLRAIRGPVTAVPMVGASGVIVEPDTVNNQVVVRADETVLFEVPYTEPVSGHAFTESVHNFNMIRIDVNTFQGCTSIYMNDIPGTYWVFGFDNGVSNAAHTSVLMRIPSEGLSFYIEHTKKLSSSFTSNSTSITGTLDDMKECVYRIVGINRKANA